MIWSAVGSAIILWPGGVTGHPFLSFFLAFLAQYAVLGFLGGVAFSLVLSMVEGRLSFREMSLPRFAAWGACGGFAMWGLSGAVGTALSKVFFGAVPPPVLNWVGRTPGLTYVLLGAVSAAMVLALARLVGGSESDELPEGDRARLLHEADPLSEFRSGELSHAEVADLR